MSWRCYKVGTLLKFLVTRWANPNPLYAKDMERIQLWLSVMVNEFVSQNGDHSGAIPGNQVDHFLTNHGSEGLNYLYYLQVLQTYS